MTSAAPAAAPHAPFYPGEDMQEVVDAMLESLEDTEMDALARELGMPPPTELLSLDDLGGAPAAAEARSGNTGLSPTESGQDTGPIRVRTIDPDRITTIRATQAFKSTVDAHMTTRTSTPPDTSLIRGSFSIYQLRTIRSVQDWTGYEAAVIAGLADPSLIAILDPEAVTFLGFGHGPVRPAVDEADWNMHVDYIPEVVAEGISPGFSFVIDTPTMRKTVRLYLFCFYVANHALLGWRTLKDFSDIRETSTGIWVQFNPRSAILPELWSEQVYLFRVGITVGELPLEPRERVSLGTATTPVALSPPFRIIPRSRFTKNREKTWELAASSARRAAVRFINQGSAN